MGPIIMDTNGLDSVMSVAINFSIEEESIIKATGHTKTPFG